MARDTYTPDFKRDCLTRIAEAREQNGGVPPWTRLQSELGVPMRTLIRWYEQTGRGANLSVIPGSPTPELGRDEVSSPSIDLKHVTASAFHHWHFAEMWADLHAARSDRGHSAVAALHRMLAEVYERFAAARAAEGADSSRLSPLEVRRELEAAARSMGPDDAAVVVEALRARGLA